MSQKSSVSQAVKSVSQALMPDTFFMGAINLVLGLLLLSSPVAAALAVPMTFGALLLIQGVVLIVLAFRVRSA